MHAAARPPERSRQRLAQRATVGAISVATVASLAWLATLIRPSGWVVGTTLWLAAAWSALPFLALARTRPATPPAPPAREATVTTIVSLRESSPAVARAHALAIAALGPCVAVTTDPACAAAVGSTDVPVFPAATLAAAISAAAGAIESDAVLIVSDAALPNLAIARRAAGLLEDQSIGWVTGITVPFNRDGYAPTARERLGQQFRRDLRADGGELWEPDATLVRTELLRNTPLDRDPPWGRWLHRLAGDGWRGIATGEVLAVLRMPVTADEYWRRTVREHRVIAADLAGTIGASPGRARVRAAAVLARELFGWSFALLLLAPALVAMSGEVPFRAPQPVVLAAVVGLAALRWATLRWVHDVSLRPGRELLAAAYDAPASILATSAACTRRVRSPRIPLPPRPLGWVALALALLLVGVVVDEGRTPSQATAVAAALVELLLLWSFTMHGIVQLLRSRVMFRIPVELQLTIDGHPARSFNASPTGLGARQLDAPPPLGAVVALEIELDDGRTVRDDARVRHWEPLGAGRGNAVGLELQLTDQQVGTWAAQLARVAVATAPSATADHAAPAAPRRRWMAVARFARACVVAVVLVPIAGVLTLPVFGLHSAVVISASMVPALRTGDVVIVREIPVRQLDVGDIATIDLTGDGGLTHRVVDLEADGDRVILTTRGDANAAVEQWELAPDQPVGRVDARVPWVGRVASRIGTTVPRSVVTAAVLLVTAGMFGAAARGRRRRPA